MLPALHSEIQLMVSGVEARGMYDSPLSPGSLLRAALSLLWTKVPFRGMSSYVCIVFILSAFPLQYVEYRITLPKGARR